MDVVALKADKGVIPGPVKEILIELGNPKQAIPYYAIYGPDTPDPVTLEALITSSMVVDAVEKVSGKASADVVASR